MIRIAIVDDHQLFRQGLGAILAAEKEFEIIGEYKSAVDLLKYLHNLDVDVILLDIDMPDLDGISAMPEILKSKADVRVIIVSMHLQGDKIQAAVNQGVNGYLLKTANDKEVCEAIQAVMQGRDYFCEEANASLRKSMRPQTKNQGIELTSREKDILKLIYQELNTQEISDKLSLSYYTVETHRKNLMSKTGSKNSIGLIKFAIEHGLDQ